MDSEKPCLTIARLRCSTERTFLACFRLFHEATERGVVVVGVYACSAELRVTAPRHVKLTRHALYGSRRQGRAQRACVKLQLRIVTLQALRSLLLPLSPPRIFPI